MNQDDIQNSINNKQLEVKNTVYLNKEKIERLEKYNFNKISLVLFIIILLLVILNYFNNFIGLLFIVLILASVLFVISLIINIYIKSTIKKLNKQIRNLELYFKELDSKKDRK